MPNGSAGGLSPDDLALPATWWSGFNSKVSEVIARAARHAGSCRRRLDLWAPPARLDVIRMCLRDGEWDAGELPSAVVGWRARALGTADGGARPDFKAPVLFITAKDDRYGAADAPRSSPRRPPRRRRGALRSCLVTPMAPACSSARTVPTSRPRSSTSSTTMSMSYDEAAYFQADDRS